MRISVIIPTFNRAEYLQDAVDSICLCKFEASRFEILIIDNASTDSTKERSEKLIQKYDGFKIRYFYEPIPGLMSGRHRGANEANGEIITFIDDDVIVSDGWLLAIDTVFDDATTQLAGGICAPRYEGKQPKWLKYLWEESPYNTQIFTGLSLVTGGEKPMEVHPNYIWGLNFSIRKTAFFELGGTHPDTLPKALQSYQGDGETGLTMKAANKGYKAIYHPEICLEHRIPVDRLTEDYFFRRWYFQGVANSYSDTRASKKNKKGEKTIVVHKPDMPIWKRTIRLIINPLALIKKIKFRLCGEYKAELLKKQLRNSYNQGYNFHQKAIRNNPELINWINKTNYLNYELPTSEKVDNVRSY